MISHIHLQNIVIGNQIACQHAQVIQAAKQPVNQYDLLDTLDANNLEKVTLIGHSMGGKAVMALTALAPERISGLVVIDVAPVDYHVRRHDEIFAAINAVTNAGVSTRQQAAVVMREHLDEEGVIQFLLKSFVDGQWRFNVPVLWEQYVLLP